MSDIRRLLPQETKNALKLVLDVFMEFEAPDYSDEGVETFKKTGIEDNEYIANLDMYGAFEDEQLAGVIATRNQGSHIALFFIKGEYQKRGIGTALFKEVLSDSDADEITVNSSPYAKEIYHHLGFTDTDSEQEVDGIIFIPMVYRKSRFIIREMKSSDWEVVSSIYSQALIAGHSTFNTICPTYEEWNRAHSQDCRLVCQINGSVAGWAAISPTSSRQSYRGVVEVSIYIDQNYQGQGLGTALLKKLSDLCSEHGYWCLYSAIFSINKPSIYLHKKCGFREIGYRERIAKDRFGNWQNTTLMEKRLNIN